MANKLLDLDGLGRVVSNINTKYQQKLVSGSNIKTINYQSLLGYGNINISGAGATAVNPSDIDTSHIYLIIPSRNSIAGSISWYSSDDDDISTFPVRNPAFIINGTYYSQVAVSTTSGAPTLWTGTITRDYGSLWGSNVIVLKLN